MPTTPNDLGLQARPGSAATIGGVTYVGDANGNWVPSPGAPSAGAAAPAGVAAPVLPFSPYEPSVSAGTVDTAGNYSGAVQFANPNAPNYNYPTRDFAGQAARSLGANLVEQGLAGNYGPAGAPSHPTYLLDFGYGAPVDAGVIASGLRRYNADTGQYTSDRIEDILARVRGSRYSGILSGAGPSGKGVEPLPLGYRRTTDHQYAGQTPTWPTQWGPVGGGPPAATAPVQAPPQSGPTQTWSSPKPAPAPQPADSKPAPRWADTRGSGASLATRFGVQAQPQAVVSTEGASRPAGSGRPGRYGATPRSTGSRLTTPSNSILGGGQ